MAHQKCCSVPRIHFQVHCFSFIFFLLLLLFLPPCTAVHRCPSDLSWLIQTSAFLSQLSLCSKGWCRHLRFYYTSVFLSFSLLWHGDLFYFQMFVSLSSVEVLYMCILNYTYVHWRERRRAWMQQLIYNRFGTQRSKLVNILSHWNC